MAKIDTKLDAAQVIKQAYDEPTKSFRVDAKVSASISDVTIADPDGDQMDVNPDGSINVNILNPLDVEISAADGDNIAISDGTDTLAINSDGSINIADNGGSITVDNAQLTSLNTKTNNNYGVVTGAIRTASQIGNTTGPASFGLGATSAQTLRTTSNISDGNANPLTSSSVAANRLLHTQTPDSVTTTSTLANLDDAVSISVEGLSSVGFQINPGTFIGILVAESSVDGGINWAIVPFYDPANSSVLTSLIFVSPNDLKIVSIVPIGGSSHVRVRVSIYTSGDTTGLLRATQISGTTGAVTASAFGTVVNTFPLILANTVTQILPTNVNRKYAYIANNSASTLRIQFSSGTGLTATTGLSIPSQETFEIKGDNLYTGPVYALSSSDIDLSVTEGTP